MKPAKEMPARCGVTNQLRENAARIVQEYLDENHAGLISFKRRDVAQEFIMGFLAASVAACAITLREKYVATSTIIHGDCDGPQWWRSPMFVCSNDPKGSACEVVPCIQH